MISELAISIINDLSGRKQNILDNDTHIKAALDWLLLAQRSTGTGGYSSAYSLYFGWRGPFPETTGYIIPTMLGCHKKYGDKRYLDSALNAGRWLISIQDKEGHFFTPSLRLPMAFDSGQILFGLLALYQETEDRLYYDAAIVNNHLL